jgi:hypothetical protein
MLPLWRLTFHEYAKLFNRIDHREYAFHMLLI